MNSREAARALRSISREVLRLAFRPVAGTDDVTWGRAVREARRFRDDPEYRRRVLAGEIRPDDEVAGAPDGEA